MAELLRLQHVPLPVLANDRRIYYEHAHGCSGAGGADHVFVARLLAISETRGWVKRLGGSAAVLVVVQGSSADCA